MYKYWGDTGIQMYNVFNDISEVILVLINLLFYKKKVTSLGRMSLNFSTSFSKRQKYTHNKEILAIIEILLVSFFQYKVGSVFNGFLGDLVGTGANYFGMLFFSPVAIAFICFLMGTDVFKQIDLATPAYPFTFIFVRLACFCAGCCNGMACSFGLYNHETEQVELPLQLIEAFCALVIFVIILVWQKKAKEGTLFPIYLILYSSIRFFTEFFSSLDKVFFIFNVNQILSVITILLAVFYIYVLKNYKVRIRRFYNDYYDAVEVIYKDVKSRFKHSLKGNQPIVHHGKQKNNKRYFYANTKKNIKISNMKRWILVWSLGLMGQTAWNIESTWFSTYIYEKIDKTPTIITPMLYLGAFATTIAVFLFGTISDRTGKRRTLISVGFIIWGLLSIGFSFTQFLPKINLTLAAVCIVVVDMLISFFAAMSVSVGFSTWISDNLGKINVGQVGGAIAAQTVLGSLLATVMGGILIGEKNNYIRLFIISGIILIFIGCVSAFLFDSKDDVKPSVRGSFFKQLSELFNFKIIFKRKELFWINVTIALFFIGFDSYFPHLGNYLTQYLGYTADKMGVIEAIPMVSAMFITLPVSKLINKNKFITVTLISVVLGFVGGYSMFKVSPQNIDVSRAFNLQLFIPIFLMAVSYIIMLQATKTWTKNLYPEESKGQYESFWAVSYTFIPVFFGSNLGDYIIRNEGLMQINEMTHRYEYIPNGKIFLVGVIISVFSIIPILIAKKYVDKKNSLAVTEETNKYDTQ